ncbi:MAG: TetR/AcrR family transcriptional regulator [Corynebacteriales bacterium]|nr:TetR/AcrR family transcriptional regulator [Mycobacteriales bacterium]
MTSSTRPGGRTARVRSAVLTAAGDALAEHGFAHLDLADVARRAEVGKTTVYRRWGNAAGLVADLLIDMAEQSLPRADTGTLEGDLIANAQLVRNTLTDPRQGPLFKSLIAVATCDDEAAAALHRFYDTRINEWAPCVEQAIKRKELPEDTDSREVIRAVSAPLYYRFLISGDPIDEPEAERSALAAIAAARAGNYARRA